MDFVTASLLNQLGVMTVIGAFALAVITEKLVWHTRLKEVEARAERWERVALEALTVGAKAGVEAAETASDIVGALPDPTKGSKG